LINENMATASNIKMLPIDMATARATPFLGISVSIKKWLPIFWGNHILTLNLVINTV